MNPWDERRKVAAAMIHYGGGFVSALGKALAKADFDNADRIKAAFPEYWDRYKKMAGES